MTTTNPILERHSLIYGNEPCVLSQVRNRIGHLTLNRPAELNALTLEMVRLLHRQLEAWEVDPGVSVVVLRSSNPKAFCAGGDIRALHDSYRSGDTQHQTFFEEEYALDHYIHGYGKPILALMDGFVLGGGMGLVQGASVRVITERTKMGMPEVSIGYFPDVGSSYFLSRLPGELGTYLGLTGIQVRAADALYAGLADWCIDSRDLPELDRRLDSMPRSDFSREALLALVCNLATRKLPGSELKAMRLAIDEHFCLEDVHQIREALVGEQRPEFQHWAEETLSLLDSRSPLSLCVTRELLRRGRVLSLPSCFALELHLARQWFAKGDIVEGVRALIIDKDKSPRWNPQRLQDVTVERFGAFFEGFEPDADNETGPSGA